MKDILLRMISDGLARLDGPLHFRVFLQPSVAVFFAIRDGLRDLRADHPAYTWSLLTERRHRFALMRSGWKSVSKIFILAIGLDVIYQAIVYHWFYPVETLLVAVILALVPYVLVRGPLNRIMRHWHRPTSVSPQKTVKVATAGATDRPRK